MLILTSRPSFPPRLREKGGANPFQVNLGTENDLTYSGRLSVLTKGHQVQSSISKQQNSLSNLLHIQLHFARISISNKKNTFSASKVHPSSKLKDVWASISLNTRNLAPCGAYGSNFDSFSLWFGVSWDSLLSNV